VKAISLIACAVVLPVLIGACDAQPQPAATSITTRSTTMKPSVTYLHLLKHTPFFTGLTTDQLRWVIAHSHEWEAQAGTVVAQCNDSAATAEDQAMWILLDGGWQVEVGPHAFPADHAGAGKWFSAAAASGTACRLVTTEHSYVMKIERADFDAMLAQGFAFGTHLDAGRRYYGQLFAAPAELAK
jgi:hypothetical protein